MLQLLFLIYTAIGSGFLPGKYAQKLSVSFARATTQVSLSVSLADLKFEIKSAFARCKNKKPAKLIGYSEQGRQLQMSQLALALASTDPAATPAPRILFSSPPPS